MQLRTPGNMRATVAKGLAITALVATGVALNADILAQPAGVTATPAAAPAASPATDGIALADPKASAVKTPSAPEAWGGQRTGTEATLSDRVVNYDIDATLDPVKHTVTGKEKLTWRNRSAVPVRSVYLHLYLNGFEGQGSTWMTEGRYSKQGFRSGVDAKDGEWGHIELRTVAQGGAKVNWSFVHPDNGPATDHTVVKMDLPAPVAPGGSTTLDIDFLSQLPRVVARTGYFDTFHLVGQWYPKMGVLEIPGERGATAPRWNVHEFHQQSEFYADFGSFDVRLTAPKDYTVGATGELQGTPVEKDGMLTHRYVQGDVHDFAWTADKHSGKPLEDTWTFAGSPTVKVRVLYPNEYAASAAPALKAAKDSLTYFSKTLGAYPYKTLTVVIPPFNANEAGGMEYPTFFTASGFREVPKNTIAEFELDFVTIHEFGHGYFYGILANNEFEEPMLDEGLNEYWDQRMMVERKQDIHPSTPFLNAIGFHPVFKVFDFERAGAPRDEPADPVGQNAYSRLQGMGPIYVRTSTMMHDLEVAVGKDAIERAFKEYYKRWKFRHPSVADLRETLAEVTGQRAAVEKVFADQVYATMRVDDRIDKFTSSEEEPQPGTAQVGGKWVETTQKQVDKNIKELREKWEKANPDAKPGTGPFPYRTSVVVRRRGASVPQTLVVKFADGSSETVKWDNDDKWMRYTWTKPVKAVSAELDPQRQHYLDVNKLDDSRTIKADTSAKHRWGGDFAAFINILLSLIATV